MSRVIDFDAFRSEQKLEPVVLRLGGREYQLPPSMPAPLALEVIRMQAEGDDFEFKPEDVARLGAQLFGGQATLDKILVEGAVTMDELPDLIKQVFTMYSPEAPVPNREARRARAKTSRS